MSQEVRGSRSSPLRKRWKLVLLLGSSFVLAILEDESGDFGVLEVTFPVGASGAAGARGSLRLDSVALQRKVPGMDAHQASSHLEVIRTLMERTALYRRALAPSTLVAGGLGLVAGAVGWALGMGAPRSFGLYWMGVAALALIAGLLCMRRQALRDREMFWSPPARRVVQALLPPFAAALAAGVLAVAPPWREPLQMWWLPAIWMTLYGCGLNAAGFFMPRGIRLFGWLFVLGGCLLAAVLNARSYGSGLPDLAHAHLLMGAAFGGLHLLYGIYLLQTRTAATTP